MFTYAPMKCRACGGIIIPSVTQVETPKTAGSYADCIYHCPNEACGVAFTNATSELQRRMIHPDYRLNVPSVVRDGLMETLPRALNVRNRPTKLLKFAFETSEDALTWTTFKYLWTRREIGSALDIEAFRPTSMWFWGVPWPSVEADTLRGEIEAVLCDQLGEQRASMSEPDFIAEDADRLVFVEVKYGAANDCKPDYKGFPQYLRTADELFLPTANAVASAGYYELVRNWVVGSTLAKQRRRRFTLINLAAEKCRSTAAQFAQSLRQTDDRRFKFISWTEFLGRLTQPMETWFQDYVEQRGLIALEKSDGTKALV